MIIDSDYPEFPLLLAIDYDRRGFKTYAEAAAFYGDSAPTYTRYLNGQARPSYAKFLHYLNKFGGGVYLPDPFLADNKTNATGKMQLRLEQIEFEKRKQNKTETAAKQGDWLDAGTIETNSGHIRFEAAPGVLHGFVTGVGNRVNWRLGEGPGRVYESNANLGSHLPQYSKILTRKLRSSAILPQRFVGITLESTERGRILHFEKVTVRGQNNTAYAVANLSDPGDSEIVIGGRSELGLIEIVCGAHIPV